MTVRGKRFEPGELDTHALAHEPEFTKMFGQRRNLGAIAAVERRQCGKRCERVGSRHDVAGRASEVYHMNGRASRLGAHAGRGCFAVV